MDAGERDHIEATIHNAELVVLGVVGEGALRDLARPADEFVPASTSLRRQCPRKRLGRGLGPAVSGFDRLGHEFGPREQRTLRPCALAVSVPVALDRNRSATVPVKKALRTLLFAEQPRRYFFPREF